MPSNAQTAAAEATLTKREVYERTVEYLEDCGHFAELREDYSGRGMYGKSVPAIVTDASATVVGAAVFRIAMEHLVNDNSECKTAEDAIDELDDAENFVPKREDSMGLQMIYY